LGQDYLVNDPNTDIVLYSTRQLTKSIIACITVWCPQWNCVLCMMCFCCCCLHT